MKQDNGNRHSTMNGIVHNTNNFQHFIVMCPHVTIIDVKPANGWVETYKPAAKVVSSLQT